MSDNERDQEAVDREFRRIVDSFIDLANQHGDQAPHENIGMALLYAASRYNAFVVASRVDSLEQYEADRDKAVDFFTGEYTRMLNENLDDYKQVFDESMKYLHLMKRH